MPEDKVTEALRFAAEPLSLSEPLREDGDAELGDVVEDRSAESPFEVAATALLPEEIARLLAPLDEREREILKLRFGLDRGEPRTLEEVGEHFNLTRERIRQIEARAMSKLRHPSSRHRRPRPARRLTPRSSRRRVRRGRPLSPCATTSPPPGPSSCPTMPTAWSTTTATSSSTPRDASSWCRPWDAAPDLTPEEALAELQADERPEPVEEHADVADDGTLRWAFLLDETDDDHRYLGLYGYVLAPPSGSSWPCWSTTSSTAPGPSTRGGPSATATPPPTSPPRRRV